MKSKYIIGTLLAGAGVSATANASEAPPPNVILILADDMAMGDISCYNKGINETPTIDQLIENGVSFTQAYSAAPVSAPARASLLTGLYPHTTGCVTLNMKRFPELTRIQKSLPTLADVFKANGYKTALIGKWHNGIGEDYHPLDRGFDVFEGYYGFNLTTYNDYCITIQREDVKVKGNYLTDDLSERAVNFVRENKDKPFFLHLAHSAPHVPLGAPENTVEKYTQRGCSKKIATLYAMIEIMDKGIGDLMKELKRLNLSDNTIVIFSSDNGADPSFPRFNMNFKGTKYTVNEGGIHVPFIVSWGKNLKKKQSDDLIHFTDVMSTLIELCALDASLVKQTDGISFARCLMRDTNPEEREEKPRFWQWNRGMPEYSHNAAIRLGDWKLVCPYTGNGFVFEKSESPVELYNIKEDPGEQYNVLKDDHTMYENLRVLLEQWSREQEYKRLNYKIKD